MNWDKKIAGGGCIPSYQMKDVVNSLGGEKISPVTGFQLQDDGAALERKIMVFIRENPGKSLNAIFSYFKQEGFSHKDILEAYNTLMYDQKIVQRLNVGTEESPRYAHFLADFFAYDSGKDVLYDVLGPV
ncbi:MAG: hypothetical protein PVF58_10145 [Candidatus Methanofastidiosia archaeon]|jgi:hypothetical protein